MSKYEIDEAKTADFYNANNWIIDDKLEETQEGIEAYDKNVVCDEEKTVASTDSIDDDIDITSDDEQSTNTTNNNGFIQSIKEDFKNSKSIKLVKDYFGNYSANKKQKKDEKKKKKAEIAALEKQIKQLKKKK